MIFFSYMFGTERLPGFPCRRQSLLGVRLRCNSTAGLKRHMRRAGRAPGLTGLHTAGNTMGSHNAYGRRAMPPT